MAPIIPLKIDNPAARSAIIKDLDDETCYKIYVWARTVKGRGTPYYIEDCTLPAARKYSAALLRKFQFYFIIINMNILMLDVSMKLCIFFSTRQTWIC